MQTKLIGGGTVGIAGVELGVDPTFQAARVSLRPLDYAMLGQVLGHYRAAGTTVAGLLATNAVLLSFRWADPSRFCVIQRVSAAPTVTATVTAQRVDPMIMTVQRSYTVSETTNVTALTPSKARVNMGASLVTQLAVASAVAGLSGGTRTADASPVASLPGPNLAAAGSGPGMDDFIRYDQLGMHPLVLAVNEGFTIAWGGTAVATGTVAVTFTLSWAEVVTF